MRSDRAPVGALTPADLEVCAGLVCTEPTTRRIVEDRGLVFHGQRVGALDVGYYLAVGYDPVARLYHYLKITRDTLRVTDDETRYPGPTDLPTPAAGTSCNSHTWTLPCPYRVDFTA